MYVLNGNIGSCALKVLTRVLGHRKNSDRNGVWTRALLFLRVGSLVTDLGRLAKVEAQSEFYNQASDLKMYISNSLHLKP